MSCFYVHKTPCKWYYAGSVEADKCSKKRPRISNFSDISAIVTKYILQQSRFQSFLNITPSHSVSFCPFGCLLWHRQMQKSREKHFLYISHQSRTLHWSGALFLLPKTKIFFVSSLTSVQKQPSIQIVYISLCIRFVLPKRQKQTTEV